MDNNEFNGGQPQQPDMNGMYEQPQQPDMTGMYEQPQQPDMAGMFNQPVQPDMAGMFNQPVQPDMTGMFNQPVQPDMTGMFNQPQQPDMGGIYPPQPPVGNGTDGKKPKKPKKPMTKGKLAAIISGGVAAVAAVVCGVIFLPKLFKSDKEVVLDAIEETFASYESESSFSDKIGAEDIQKAYQEKGGKSAMNYSVSVGDESYSFEIGLDMDTAINQEKKLYQANGAVTMNGSELLSISNYGDEQNTYLAIPELMDGYLVLPNDDPLGAIANSALGDMMDLDAGSVSGLSFNYFSSQAKSGELASGYVDALETIWDAANFEKQGKAKITVNGESVTAKEYYVTWKKEDLQDACCAAIDGMTDALVSSQATMDEMGMSADDLKYTMEQVKAMVPTLITKDLQVKVYVKGGRAVKITCKDSISLMGVSIKYDFWVDAGENDITANLGFDVMGTKVGLEYEAHDIKGNTYGSLSAYADDKKISLDFTKDVVKSGDTTTTTYKVNATDYFRLEITTNTNKDDTFDCSASLDIVGADTIVFTCAGGLKDVKKGVAYTLAIDSFEVKVANQSVITGAMTIGLDTSDTTVAERDAGATVYEIANMSEADWTNFFESNSDNLTSWMERLENEEGFQEIMELFGNSEMDDYDDYDTDDYDDYDDEDGGNTDDEVTLDNAILEAGNGSKYKVNGCIDGFEFWYGSDASVEFETENYSYLNYSLYDDESMEIAMEHLFYSVENIDGCTIVESNINQTTQIDGKDVMYCVEKYIAYDMNITEVTAITEVEPNVYMVVQAAVYTDDDNLSVEDILQAISPQYYEKVE